MNLDTVTTLLVIIAPALSAMLTIIAGVIRVRAYIKQLKKESNEEIDKSNAKLLKAYNDIAILKTKISSIEKLLLEQKEKQ